MLQLLASDVWTTVWSVLLAILILLVMITVHEFGHYLAGKALKFKINEFAIGFGPAIFKHRKKNGELVSLRALPLGGYCAFAGEDGEEEDAPDGGEGTPAPDGFNQKAPWKRIIVLVAGATMNYLLALLLIIVCFGAFGQQYYRVNAVEPSEVYAAEVSLAEGDVILAVGDREIYLATDFISALKGKSAGDEAKVRVLRDGGEQEVTVVLRGDCDFANSSDTGKIWRAFGVGIFENDEGRFWNLSAYNMRHGFFSTVGRSFVYSFKLSGTIFSVLGELLTGKLAITAVGGPVTTIKLTSEMAAAGAQSFLTIAAYIGVNLAVFNLLPIPALDGSKVVFCLIEWIFRRPVPRKVEAAIHAAGFILILGFAVLVDILQFASCG